MEPITNYIRALNGLSNEPTAEQVTTALTGLAQQSYSEIIDYLDKQITEEKNYKPIPSPEEQAQVYRDAAESDRQFDQLSDHMADWYDNEIRACYRGSSQSTYTAADSTARLQKLEKIRDFVSQQMANLSVELIECPDCHGQDPTCRLCLGKGRVHKCGNCEGRGWFLFTEGDNRCWYCEGKRYLPEGKPSKPTE